MNRLHHVKETLPKNIADNASYDNLEFIILNYNSQDHLEEWVKENLSEYVESGRLKHFRTFEPKTFNMAHSRNMVSKLASGDIVCLIDGDNYTGKDFARYVNKSFNKNLNQFLTTIGRRQIKNGKDVLGRICFRKDDFFRVEGFDEFMANYGFEDYDLANRLQLLGLKRKLICERKYLQAISHSIEERVANMLVNVMFERLFIHHISPFKSELLFLFKDNSFSLGTVINNYTKRKMSLRYLVKRRSDKYAEELLSHDWMKGKWEEADTCLTLFLDGNPNAMIYQASSDNRSLYLNTKSFFLLENDSELLLERILFHSAISNRNKMKCNLRDRKIALNNGLFGRGTVHKNFSNYPQNVL